MNLKCWLLSSVAAFSFMVTSVQAASPAMVEKNLFSQDRKPSTGEAQAPAAPSGPPVPPKTVQLDGIMIRGNLKKALVRLKGSTGPKDKDKGKKDSPFTTVSEGEKVNDYTVTKIGTRSISLEKGGQLFEVFLYAEGKVLPPLAATPAPSAPSAPGAPGQPGQPPPPARGQGTAPHADSDLGTNDGNRTRGQVDPNSAANQAAAQGPRSPRRAPPPAVEIEDLDQEGDEDFEEAGQ
ncbi:MAG: hypothetical protein AB9873_20510 [Syntrophobacteraceae bacterium]